MGWRGEGRGWNGNQLLKAINQRLQLFQDQQQQLQQQLQHNKQNGNENNTNEIDETTSLSNYNLKSQIWNVNKYQAYYIYDPIRTISLVDDVIINNNNKKNENTIQTKRRYIERESIDPVLFISTIIFFINDTIDRYDLYLRWW